MIHRTVRLAFPFLLLLYCACTTSREIGDRSGLDHAIALFIRGEYADAGGLLTELTDDLSGEELGTAYLYLGRCYMKMGRYKEALESFSRGRAWGDPSLFDLYIDRAANYYKLTSPAFSSREWITRAELACLIDRYAATGADSLGAARRGSFLEDIERHWARRSIERVLQWGYMESLPDERFHPDARVTREAFLIILARLARRKGIKGLNAPFPAGVQEKLSLHAGVSMANDRFISARDALNLLRSLAASAQNQDD